MTKMMNNYGNLVKAYHNLNKIESFKITSPIKVNNKCLKPLCDKIFGNKALQEVSFFNYENIPLFKYDNLGNYFVPKLLYRGFETLELDMSELNICKNDMIAIQDSLRDPTCNNRLQRLGLKLRRTNDNFSKKDIVDNYQKILEVIEQHRRIKYIKLYFEVPVLTPDTH